MAAACPRSARVSIPESWGCRAPPTCASMARDEPACTRASTGQHRRPAARSGDDAITFFAEVSEIIAPILPNYMGPCWFTIDPASLLMTSHFNPTDAGAVPARVLRDGVPERRRPRASVGRTVATPASARCTRRRAATRAPASAWQVNMELGGDQEMIARPAHARPARPGEWQPSTASPAGRSSTRATRRSCTAAAPALGEGARRALTMGEATRPRGPGRAGRPARIRARRGRVRHRRAWRAGSTSCPAATGRPAGSGRR